MFEFIIGDVIFTRDDYVVLQNNKIGYKIFTSQRSMEDLEIGKKDVLIYTDLVVRDDGLLLYGFSSQEEMDIFKLLLLVSRVGPKVALGILSTLSPNQIKRAILGNNKNVLCEAPGIGSKTAERIILELRDRIDPADIVMEDEEDEKEFVYVNTEEAIQGLMSLGYSRYEIEKAMKDLDLEGLDIEDIIRITLKELSK